MPKDLNLSEFSLIGHSLVGSHRAIDGRRANRLLELINSEHAREPLELEDVFIFPGLISNQAIDYYGTRMADSSIRNYLLDVKAGLALMNSHRTGGFVSDAELPVGRWIDGELEGDLIKIGGAEFDDQMGAGVLAYGYMRRGIQVTEVSNDDLIAGVDSGTIKDLSISFSPHPDGRLTCSICGDPYLPTRATAGEGFCEHLAFITYDEGRCFAWVEGAHALEASFVYEGAAPNAMVRKIEQLGRGLQPADLDFLEDHFKKVFTGRRSFLVPSASGLDDSGRLGKEEFMLDRSVLIQVISESLNPDRVDQIRVIEDDAEFVEAVALELAEQLTDVSGILADINADLESTRSFAEIGEAVFGDLVDQTVAARVRAQGAGFDADRYKEVLVESRDLEFVRSELETWETQAGEVLQGGPGKTRKADEASVSVPASAYR